MGNQQSDEYERDSGQTRVGKTRTSDPTDVYAGRGPGKRDMTETPVGSRGWLGNPYPEREYGREESIRRFRNDFEDKLEHDSEFREAVRELHGKVLGCFCQALDEDAPECHAEVIAEHADRLYWKNRAEESARHEWCGVCEKSYFAHFDECPHGSHSEDGGAVE